MKRNYVKTIIREIKQSFGRFIAIIAIVALGVGFLLGLLSTTPDMQTSVDHYYRQTSMHDFNIKSTMGLTEGDVTAISSLTQADTVMPAYVTDALMETGEEQLLSGRLYGLDLSANGTSSFIDHLTLLEGRMPQSADECVIEDANLHMTALSVGDTLTLSAENEDLSDTYQKTRFTIVGIVDSPAYFCNAKEPSTVGSGRLGVIAYTDSSAYCLDTYTDIFLTTKYDGSAFSDDYDTYIEKTRDALEALSDDRIQIRYDEIISQANEKLDDAKKKLQREKKKAEKELEDARKKLADGQKELDEGAARLKKAKKELQAGKEQLEKGKKQLKKGRSQLKDAKSQLKAGKKEYAAAKSQLNASKAQLDAVKDQVEQAKAAQAAGIPLSDEVLQQIAAYDEGMAAYEQGASRLAQEEKKLTSAEKTIAENEKKLSASQKKIQASESELKAGEKEIAENEKKLEEARKELEQGRRDYQEGKEKADREIAKGEKKIRKAQQEIEDLDEPEWYILDRDSNLSYARYKIDVEKVAAVATVFPIFFFLVAILVTLTTMTRMVEEERIQIGTLKALGYSRRSIISKYLIYCGAATVLGCGIGLAGGFQLPLVIYKAYASQYALPDLVLKFNVRYAVISCVLEILCTVGATWLACRRNLAEKPAALMVPRAPKAGKRILLERVGILWKHLSFSYKATARNIFRYKKHLFMTIIGIAGCTALMVAGFGMRDSVSRIVHTQYDDIFKYDMKIELTEDATDSTLTGFLENKDHVKIAAQTMDLFSGADSDKKKETISTNIYVPQNTDTFTEFISLRNGNTVPFGEDSAIMTQKTADELQLSVGDTFVLKNDNGRQREFTLTGITENYVGGYVYMEKSLYETAFGPPDYNTLLVKSGITGLKAEDRAAENLQDSTYVASVDFNSQTRESYEGMLDSLNLLVYVLIAFAGALAMVVLYNLTNININERYRELATLRVLGYHHNEVARYIFREIGILSILGTLVGLAAGFVLHRYIILIAESVDFMMGRDVAPLSYVLAAVITLAFSVLVDGMMLIKLRRIEMVESMKAVD